MIKSYMKYFTGNLEVKPFLYANPQRLGLLLVDADTGEIVTTATVNIPEDDYRIVIKNYSENEGVLETLIEGKIGEPRGMVRVGYASGYKFHITDDKLKSTIDDMFDDLLG